MLGFSRRQVATTLYWQATTVAFIGVLFGVPLGAGVGQIVWRTFISNVGAVPVTVVPLGVIGMLVALSSSAHWRSPSFPRYWPHGSKPGVALREA